MPVAYLTLPGLKASVHGERLEITPPPAEKDAPLPAKSSIPLLDLDQVVVDARAHLSSQSINRLLQAGIPVCFLAHGDSPSGLALPYNRQSAILAQQLDRCREDDFRLQRAKELLESKIRNMRRLLQRLSREGTDWRGTLAFLKSIRAQLAAAPSLETLRGVEGLAAARYFESYGQLFPDAFPFEKRSRRPPRNPPNSLLSFLYTLLCNEIVLEIRATGMEPGWGWLHEQEAAVPPLPSTSWSPFGRLSSMRSSSISSTTNDSRKTTSKPRMKERSSSSATADARSSSPGRLVSNASSSTRKPKCAPPSVPRSANPFAKPRNPFALERPLSPSK